MAFKSRKALDGDVQAIEALISLSMEKLLSAVLAPAQVAKSYASMGLDSQLIDDGTYFVVLDEDVLVGCGGWSRRRTLFGGDHANQRDNSFADPKTEAAKIRAMYTHPDHARRGIGTMLLELSETAAKAEGFRQMELGATASGLPLYKKFGYVVVGDISEVYEDGVIVPNFLMRKDI